ncbi:MAG TPA: hypothetical protein VFZ34_17070 [Blastocatellia bacterium]|nr:hypothetical protein [Blastocatellia bacterium]
MKQLLRNALFLLLFTAAVAVVRLTATHAESGISLTALGTAHTQNFNTLVSSGASETLPNGWSLSETGANANATYTAGDGSSNAGDTYSFGIGSDRAFGTLQSSSLVATIGACFTNNTGQTITSLDISFTGEQWRLGTAGRADRSDFQYSTDATSLITGTWFHADALDFSSPNTAASPGALDGNAAENRAVVTGSITGLSIANGTTFFVRWTDFNASGTDDGLALDDFSLTAKGGATPQPTLTAIHSVQGNAGSSPLVNTSVTVKGIVTALRFNGFFLQAAAADYDSDANTSEGVFVFTDNVPPSYVTPGSEVQVTGRVAEYRPSADPGSPPLTQVVNSAMIVLLSSGNALPAPITITSADTNPAGTHEQLEKYEGMLVRIPSLTVVAPTSGFYEQGGEANAMAASNGAFYAVVTGVPRPFREPGVESDNWPASIPRFDGNPERLRVDSDGLSGATKLEVTSGATLTNVTGIVDYGFRCYTILPLPGNQTSVVGNVTAAPVPAAAADEFTVASFNLERFFDTNDDPGVTDVALTPDGFQRRLQKASLAIRNVLRMPDIIGVEEVENLPTLQTLASKINGDAVAAGQSDPKYVAYLEEGNDPGGIDVGVLVKSTRVTVVSVTQEGKSATFVNPVNNQNETLNDRPPLILKATIAAPDRARFALTVIVNHLRSLSGIEDPNSGNRTRHKRRAQAEFLAELIQARQTADPNERIISIGDYNAFQFSDGLVDVIGTIKGTPTAAEQVVLASADLVNPDLTDLIALVPAAQRYSYSFSGNAQAIDHELVNAPLLKHFRQLVYARTNADFPESYRNDSTRPERISDHDPAVAYFSFDDRSRRNDRRDVPPRVVKPGQ